MNDDEISNKLNRFDHEIEHLLVGQKYLKENLVNKNEIKFRIKNFIDPYNRKDVNLKRLI